MPQRSQGVVWGLAIAIAAAHVCVYFLSADLQEQVYGAFAVNPARFAAGYSAPLDMLGPLIGHMFLHGGLLHLAMNLWVLLMVAGPPAARFESEEPGGLRFLALFFGSGVVGAWFHIWINDGANIPAVGASGAVCGVFAAYLMSMGRRWSDALRDRRVLTSAFWFLAINVGLAAAARMTGVLPIAWEAHLGGFIGGAALYPLLAPRWRPRPWG